MKNQLLMTRPEPKTPHRNDRDDFAPSRRVRHDRIEQLDRLSRFLDSRYRLPVLNVPVGWDSILGLRCTTSSTLNRARSTWLDTRFTQ